MKALTVNENMGFERGKDPIHTMGIGMAKKIEGWFTDEFYKKGVDYTINDDLSVDLHGNFFIGHDIPSYIHIRNFTGNEFRSPLNGELVRGEFLGKVFADEKYWEDPFGLPEFPDRLRPKNIDLVEIVPFIDEWVDELATKTGGGFNTYLGDNKKLLLWRSIKSREKDIKVFPFFEPNVIEDKKIEDMEKKGWQIFNITYEYEKKEVILIRDRKSTNESFTRSGNPLDKMRIGGKYAEGTFNIRDIWGGLENHIENEYDIRKFLQNLTRGFYPSNFYISDNIHPMMGNFLCADELKKEGYKRVRYKDQYYELG